MVGTFDEEVKENDPLLLSARSCDGYFASRPGTSHPSVKLPINSACELSTSEILPFRYPSFNNFPQNKV